MKERRKGFWKWTIIGAVSLIGFVLLLSLIIGAVGSTGFGNTAHIKVRGVITTESENYFGSVTASAADISENIRKADSNPAIKAIILDINSPGGSAVASEELATAVVNAEKPVVALIRDIGTSGAYWAASSSDLIVASPLSITGSVGATASYLEFSGLMRRYGVGYERVVSGEFKDAGSPFRNLSTEEELLFQEMIKLTGDYFAGSVKTNRNLDDATMAEISTGRIYIGQQAYDLNLVDELGNMDTAREAVKDLTGEDEIILVQYETKKPFALSSILSQQASVIGRSIAAGLFQSQHGVSLQ